MANWLPLTGMVKADVFNEIRQRLLELLDAIALNLRSASNTPGSNADWIVPFDNPDRWTRYGFLKQNVQFHPAVSHQSQWEYTRNASGVLDGTLIALNPYQFKWYGLREVIRRIIVVDGWIMPSKIPGQNRSGTGEFQFEDGPGGRLQRHTLSSFLEKAIGKSTWTDAPVETHILVEEIRAAIDYIHEYGWVNLSGFRWWSRGEPMECWGDYYKTNNWGSFGEDGFDGHETWGELLSGIWGNEFSKWPISNNGGLGIYPRLNILLWGNHFDSQYIWPDGPQWLWDSGFGCFSESGGDLPACGQLAAINARIRYQGAEMPQALKNPLGMRVRFHAPNYHDSPLLNGYPPTGQHPDWQYDYEFRPQFIPSIVKRTGMQIPVRINGHHIGHVDSGADAEDAEHELSVPLEIRTALNWDSEIETVLGYESLDGFLNKVRSSHWNQPSAPGPGNAAPGTAFECTAPKYNGLFVKPNW